MITNAMFSTFLFGEAEASHASHVVQGAVEHRRLQANLSPAAGSHFDDGDSLYTAATCDAADTEVFKLCERASGPIDLEYYLSERAFSQQSGACPTGWNRNGHCVAAFNGPQDWCPPGQEKILTKEECDDALEWMQAQTLEKLRENGWPATFWHGAPLDPVVYPVSAGGVLRVLTGSDWFFPRGCFYTTGQEVLFNPLNINTPADHVASGYGALCKTASGSVVGF